ncbi:dihydroxyacetone kinase [Streptomyces sp. S8]|uniref:dihydroxyacetone kinase subunit DhaK n=1 Tax=Streptomyces sp. S8 TaxID=1837283 RepID=UPI000A093464|nr:dihydroxyacetone kinase subunit DhaK [Streptomyces sp. S8]ARI51667.1 dihydroxyacetone kinase [Streptomyces sp. S8]
MSAYFETATGDLASEALHSFADVHADLVSADSRFGFLTARHPAETRTVGLLSGGGSGHEPLHGGYVGRGMLDAAVPGRVFASPHNRQVYEASLAVARPGGVLHLVKNYTGDRINFGIAAERLAHKGIPCARVLIDDDLASDAEGIAAGRRGTGGTVLVEKILGGAADRGMGLAELQDLGERLVAGCRSLAVATAAHTSPATGGPAFTLDEGLLEYGVGIHGERAGSTVSRRPLAELVERMTTELLDALPADVPVISLVNGLGATTLLELYAAHGQLARVLRGAGVPLARSLVGNYITSLDMHGFSITLMAGDPTALGLYDAPVHTPALRW